ncbi:Glyoxylase, beta-lactamase superfamily II [Thermomonospora echinospora]|uniref:Glyoxylase, beta-lactamase superfamily II n=1 Tax=Thermomonospora echinospora TaxID=1992 RepID=A0A1H6BVK5_9ACTN|nr:MBL fold metallo-hydrolase [Thermomonospora echinospora]SEG64662.1 Glyoxylase, beta-lactamase superfamily II [Thermomonospora echinospora]
MSYTGDVQVGGRADVRELPGLTIAKVAVGPYDNNAYLLRCTATGEQLLVDAANEPERLLELVGDGPLDRIVTTHRHQDHWQALSAVVRATGAAVVAHPFDAESLPEPVAERVEHGDRVRVGEAELEVVHLRGHTPGSIALLYDAGGELADRPHLFTGDSLFPGGVGNTWGDPALFKQLLADVEERVFDRLPDATWFYPGHGKDSTLGRERPSLPEWRARGW